jgi:serine/threonine protein kinase
MPALSDVEKKILKTVVQRFLDSKSATRRKDLLDAFESPGAIDSLVSTTVLEQASANNYLPSAIAFHYSDDPEVQALTKRGVRAVARVFKNLIKEDRPNLDPANIETLAREADSGITDKMVRVGLYVARDLGLLTASQGRNQEQVDVIPVTINEYIYEKNPEILWDQFVNRNDPHPQHAPAGANPHSSQKQKYGGWEIIERLGGGGQSDVFLVRAPERKRQREGYLDRLGKMSGKSYDSRGAAEVAEALWNYARPELTEELGALKQFKIPPESSMTLSPTLGSKDAEAVERLKNEIAVLRKGLPGLPRILDFDETERWIVTEYFPGRTLEHHPLKYKGNAVLALKAFRSLVETMALLHKEGHIHRDIKPANVFVRTDDDLVPGDFGIVFSPDVPDRLTRTGERVGPRDYMPPWANLGMRHDEVHPRDDVYMLGKLLWSMVAGHAVLPREYHKHPEYEFDLTKIFPNDPHMHMVNAILDKCVVEQTDQCLPNAEELLRWTDEAFGVIVRGGQLMREGVPRPCRICGKGFYRPVVFPQVPNALPGLRLWLSGSEIVSLPVSPLACDYCGNLEFFKSH